MGFRFWETSVSLSFREPSRREVWAGRMARYERCSLTVKEFCQREGISQPSFYQWKKKLAKSDDLGPRFVPVDLGCTATSGRASSDETATATTAIRTTTIQLPGGALIDVDARASQHDLERLLSAVVAATQAGLNATATESGDSHGGLA